MDTLPFQLDPAHHVLQQLRPSLLIADTVGLGKTLEACILTAELIRHGRARRMLVATTKSMMRRFQQEFWNLTTALTRLDYRVAWEHFSRPSPGDQPHAHADGSASPDRGQIP